MSSIYQNILSKSRELKKIDDITGEVLLGKYDSTEDVLDYLGTVNNYYASAGQHLSNVKDSVLKAKLLDILTLSRNNFASESEQFTSLLDSISWNTQRVQDRLEILKVLLTLSVIKEYEDKNKPPVSPLNEFIRRQENSERVLDSVISVNSG